LTSGKYADVLDQEPLIGGKGNDRGGLVYLPVTVKKTGKCTLGCGADYWMEVFLDGTSVIDRSQSGTGKVPADGAFMLSYREYAVFLLRFRHAEN